MERKSARKRPRVEWVSAEHMEMRKRLRTMSLDEMAQQMLDLKHQLAIAQATAAHSQTEGPRGNKEDDVSESVMDIDLPPSPARSMLASFVDMPQEMMASVIARLSPSDVLAAGETCRLVHQVVMQHRYVLELNGITITDQTVQWINQFARLGVLVLTRIYLSPNANPLSNLNLPALREIYMSNMLLPDHGAFLSKLNGLQKLHLSHVNNTSAAGSFKIPIPASLETLAVVMTPLYGVSDPVTARLKHLVYHSIDSEAAINCMRIVGQFQASLQTLECGTPRPEAFDPVTPLNLCNLQSLKMHDTWFTTIDASTFTTVPFLFGTLPSLTRLEWDTIIQVDEAFLVDRVAPHTPALRELVVLCAGIQGIQAVQTSVDHAWATAFPHLELLKMTAPRLVGATDKEQFSGLLRRISHMQSMRHLSISNVALTLDSAMLWSICRLKTLQLETLVLGDIGPLSMSDILTLYTFIPTLKNISIF